MNAMVFHRMCLVLAAVTLTTVKGGRMVTAAVRRQRRPLSAPRPQLYQRAGGREPRRAWLRDFEDIEYVAEVGLGTPAQTLALVLDTGSADFWVASAECAERGFRCQRFCRIPEFRRRFCHAACRRDSRQRMPAAVNTCAGRALFRPNQSATFVPLDQFFQVVYGTGNARGQLSRDTLRLGQDLTPLVIPEVTVGQAFEIADFFRQMHVDGILGLGLPDISTTHTLPPFVDAVERGLVEPVFTVWMSANGMDSHGQLGGRITFGGLDADFCEVEHMVLVPLSEPGFWQFTVTEVAVRAANDARTSRIKRPFQAISDTGTSFLVLEQAVFDLVAHALHAHVLQLGDRVAMQAACDTQFRLSLFVSDIANNRRELRLSEAELMLRPGHAAPGQLCELTVGVAWGESVSILGDALMRAYCNVHDVRKKRIGFAARRLPASTTPIPMDNITASN